ncbi:MAG: CapA family protein [Oscillatoriales cyanobacterium RM2_1_1]|nr:CapA family protein [Oscillatoriales cyanobacterium SM2_3_0]NJO46706.1 CapA family protein [Oscillatoriales cyanobacterium RM2_1_1]
MSQSVQQSDVVSLARKGNPDAIAELLSRALQGKRVRAKATRREHHLYVLLESSTLPDQAACIRVVQNGMFRLEAQGIQLVTVVGQQIGKQVYGWTHTLKFQPPASPIKTSIRPFQRSKPATSKLKPPEKSRTKSAPALTPTVKSQNVKSQSPTLPSQPIPVTSPSPQPIEAGAAPAAQAPVKVPAKVPPKTTRTIPVKSLIMAGSIGLLLAPLSGWLFAQPQEKVFGFFQQTLPQTLATVPQVAASAWNQGAKAIRVDLPQISWPQSNQNPAQPEGISASQTLKNLNQVSDLALTAIQNPVGPDTRIKLKAVGDIIPGTNYPSNKLHPQKEALFSSVKPILGGSDILFGNFESTLTNYPNSAKNIGRGLVFAFRTPPEYTSILQDAGFNVLSVANNHSFDFFETGFEDTIQNIDKAGMKAVGKRDQIVYTEAKGVKFAFIGFSYFPVHNNMLETEAAQAIVRKANENADVVVISVHAGAEGTAAIHVRDRTEYFYGENRGNTVEFARAMIDAGADLILGHGPHVPRALDLYKGKLIAYSLGNFMGYRTLSAQGQLGYSLVLEADLDPVGNFKGGKIIPVRLTSQGIPYPDDQGRSIGLIRDLTRSDFPKTPLNIDDQGVISVQE